MPQDYNTPERYYAAIREILLKMWDPIGVAIIDPETQDVFLEAQDEYDSYIPGIYAMLSRNTSAQLLFAHLWQIETIQMGSVGNA